MGDLISSVLGDAELIWVDSESSINDCARLMVEKRIGAVVVKDASEKVLGLISERDVTRKCVGQQLDANQHKAKDIVFTDVTVLDKQEPIEKAMEAVINTRRRHVLVEDNGEVVSIVSIGDLMKHLLKEKSQMIEHLENYIRS